MSVAKQEGLEKKFKLSTTIGTTNMRLFDSDGKIRKYDTPEDILKDFFKLRLQFYGRREAVMLQNIGEELLMLKNKVIDAKFEAEQKKMRCWREKKPQGERASEAAPKITAANKSHKKLELYGVATCAAMEAETTEGQEKGKKRRKEPSKIGNNSSAPPGKKVRKMRASHFNNKSSFVL
uniref:DNA topoisomerase (ATP-hydrolyzing) n=1 Tax=Aegilops tauschii subsp. strangulata TaxID=200361 RepID=A0A453T0C9_AEGTS